MTKQPGTVLTDYLEVERQEVSNGVGVPIVEVEDAVPDDVDVCRAPVVLLHVQVVGDSAEQKKLSVSKYPCRSLILVSVGEGTYSQHFSLFLTYECAQ